MTMALPNAETGKVKLRFAPEQRVLIDSKLDPDSRR